MNPVAYKLQARPSNFDYSLSNFEIRLVIVRNIWQKLSSVEHKKMLIVRNFWQLFSHIFGETSLIVRNIWRNRTAFREFVSS
jgi:hypothetical protein